MLVFLLENVDEVEKGAAAGVVWYHILAVGHTPEVGHLSLDVVCESLVADTRRAEVVALNIGDAVLVEVHCSKRGQGCTQTVAGNLDLGGWICGPQLVDLGDDRGDNALLSVIETCMYVAVTVGEGGVSSLGCIEVRDPVEER